MKRSGGQVVAVAKSRCKTRAATETSHSARIKVDEAVTAKASADGLLQTPVDGFCVMDLKGNVINVNDALLEMLDLAREEIEGLPLAKALGPLADKIVSEDASATIERLATGVQVGTTDLPLTTKHGRALLVSISYSVARDSKGDLAMLFAVVRDITQRQQVEVALRESEQRFRELTDLLPQCVFEIDLKGNLTYSNRYGFEAYGYTPEDLAKGMNTRHLVSLKDRRRVIRNMRRALAGIKSEGNEYIALRKDETTFPVLVYTSPIIRDGQAVGIRGIALDITKLKKAEDQLRRRNRELNALNQIVETANYSFGLQDILTNTLSRMLDILHIRHGNIYLFTGSAKHGSDLRCVRMSDKRPRRDHLMMLCEAHVRRAAKSGRTIFVKSLSGTKPARVHQNALVTEQLKSLICVPLIARGRTLGVLVAATEGKRVFTPEERDIVVHIGHTISTTIENAQLREQATKVEALQELDRLKTDLLANISHELRAPLAAIKGFASSLLRQDVEWDRDTQVEFLGTIIQESDRLTAMVSRLLQMSALESGQVQANLSLTHVSEIFDMVKPNLIALTSSHELDLVIPEDLAPVTADAEMIGEVVINLVENAVRCSDAATRISLQAQVTSDGVIISVADEGIGVPSEYLEKIFDRFYRVDRGIKQGGIGTGLGLAICKEIVLAHNGRIWAESIVGSGSKFSFFLPTVPSDIPSTA